MLDETHLALTNREAEELEREARGAEHSSDASTQTEAGIESHDS